MPIQVAMTGLTTAQPTHMSGPELDRRRLAAGLVDFGILLLVGVVLALLSGGSTAVTAPLTLGWTLYYFFALESGTGQTVGKRLLGIRVVRADGEPAGMNEIAIRTALRVVDGVGFYLVALIVMLATGRRRQRLGDLAAGTVVTDAAASEYAIPFQYLGDEELQPEVEEETPPNEAAPREPAFAEPDGDPEPAPPEAEEQEVSHAEVEEREEPQPTPEKKRRATKPTTKKAPAAKPKGPEVLPRDFDAEDGATGGNAA